MTELEDKMRARIKMQREHISRLRIAAAEYMHATSEWKKSPQGQKLSKAIADATEALC